MTSSTDNVENDSDNCGK